MSVTAARKRTGMAFVVALVLWGAVAASAVAATSTITRADCLNGRITRNGAPVPQAECLRHVGQGVNLAHTGFDVWIVALAGGACLAGAALLRLRPRQRTSRA
ncbi:MAG: hypothetical protein JOZ25_02090 [Actinobacteria bacterium]|nr:hypothetical protein [Actinomycetota bacterium]